MFFSSTARIESTPSEGSDWSGLMPSTPRIDDRSPFTFSPMATRRSLGGSWRICVMSASACTDDDASDHFMESKTGWSPKLFSPVSNGNTTIWYGVSTGSSSPVSLVPRATCSVGSIR